MRKAELEKALKSQVEASDSLKAQLTLLQADFENAKKRWLKQQAEAQEKANAEVLRQLLEIFDDFERAHSCAEQAAGSESLRAGVEMIAQRMKAFLKSYGVEPIGALEKPFDPAYHEAVAHEVSESAPESSVLAELRKGYLMNGRVLRHSVVKVAVKPDKKSNLKIK